MRLVLIVFLFIGTTSCFFSPLSTTNRALKQLEKGEQIKSKELLIKAMEKDSLLPAVRFAKSKWLLSYGNPHLYDSAYYYILTAQSILDTLATKAKIQHQKKGYDSVAFQLLKLKIDSLAYGYATIKNNEDFFNEFIRKYPTAKQLLLAKTKRNALAFVSAREINTYQSYKTFIDKYPDAIQIEEAIQRYEQLYFDKSTADGKVSSFLNFLNKHPETPYRKVAEQRIFEVITAEHTMGGYLQFLKKFPKSHLKQKTINYAYHISKSNGLKFPNYLINDSLQHAILLETPGLVPFINEGFFGFMDVKGNVIIKPQFENVKPTYKCDVVSEDFLMVKGMLIGRNQAVISGQNYQEVIDMGFGLLKVKYNDLWGVIHKSGEQILKAIYSDIKLLNNNVLAVKKDDSWQLQTISGRVLFSDDIDDAFQLGEFFILEKDELFNVKNTKQLMRAVDNNPQQFYFEYIDYELLPDGNLWMKSNSEEVVFNTKMEEVIAQSEQNITVLDKGFLVTNSNDNTLLNDKYHLLLNGIQKPKFNHSWLIDLQDSVKLIVKLSDLEIKQINADSLSLLGHDFLIVNRNDSILIFLPNGTHLSFDESSTINLLKGNKAEYLQVKNHNTSLYNNLGMLLTKRRNGEYTSLGKEYIVIDEKNKKGIISSNDGKVLLRTEYDGIGNYVNGSISLLKNQKFGMFNVHKEVYIPTHYDKNVMTVTDSIYVGEKNKRKFIIDQKGNKLSKEGFDEVLFWNDTSLLVKERDDWRFLNLKNEELSSLKFQSYSVNIIDTLETLLIIRSDNKYGLVSNRRSEIIPPTFNDIVLIKNSSSPIVFTEKHIEEAEFYVVIYYNLEGQIIRKQALDAKTYDLLYCDE